MILRRFTQHIKEQNWFAVGLDVIVVIVGIFMGMQVTEWNDERQHSVMMTEYLNNMRLELSDDIEDWEREKSRNSEKIKDLLSIIISLRDTEKIEDKVNFIRTLQRSFRSAPIVSNNSVYTDMLSSGNLKLIKSQQLRQKIIDHYNWVERFEAHSQREYDLVWNKFIPYFNDLGYFDWGATNEAIPREKNVSESLIFSLELGSPEFKALENNLAFRRITLLSQNSGFDKAIKDTKELLEFVTNEI